jgi:ABC-type branched-subunit amino acid transport system ATPase component
MTALALQLVDLHKSFGATPIIRGISLDVAQGERHCIIGPNGAGKSTLFHLVSGRFPVMVCGSRAKASPAWRRSRSTGAGCRAASR